MALVSWRRELRRRCGLPGLAVIGHAPQRATRVPTLRAEPTEGVSQERCGGQSDCVCSSFDSDVDDYADFAAYVDGASSERNYAPVDYLFCPDDRTNDISWCSRFDAGRASAK